MRRHLPQSCRYFREAALIRRRVLPKLQTPKSRRRTQELNAHTLALVSRIAQKHHPALQLLFRVRIGQHQHLSLLDFVLQQEQPAVRIHHHGFAHFAEFPPVVISPVHFYPHFVKHAPAAAWRGESSLAHASILRWLSSRRQLHHRTGVLRPQGVSNKQRKGRRPRVCFSVSSFPPFLRFFVTSLLPYFIASPLSRRFLNPL